MKRQNYLDRKPRIRSEIEWSTDETGKVTIEIEHKKFLRKLLKLPKVSYVHLDTFGSFVWREMDGKKDVYEIGKKVKTSFGKETEPLYERLIKYFIILDSYRFIKWI